VTHNPMQPVSPWQEIRTGSYLSKQSSLLRLDPLLTGEDVTRRARLAAGTLTTWRSREPGKAPRAVKLAKIVRYRTSDVMAWLGSADANAGVLVPLAPEDLVLTHAEAADYLALSGPSMSTWRSRQPEYAPKGFKRGASLRYHLSELNAWVDRHLEPESS
jgi:predicted DNA-binding transcriptional regulator AlpA